VLSRPVSVFVLGLFLGSCSNEPDRLEKILAKGEIVVLTRNAATAFYESREGYQGVEFEMTKAFADSLGVTARYVLKDDISDLFNTMDSGYGDIAAAGLTHTEERGRNYLFGPTYQMVPQQLVCRRGGKRPKKFEDLVGISIKVPVDSSYIDQLKKIKLQHAEVSWEEVSDTDTESLLEDVWQKKIDCTVADANIVAINRRYFPELSIRFNMTKPEPLAWALPADAESLQEKIDDWFEDYKKSGKLDEVMHRYYGYIEQFDYVDARAYQRKIKSHLPRFKNIFKEAAKKFNMSWTLIAAQAYQESHWNPYAKSPTGVRGMMMLTQLTARQLGISNRLNPQASIMGGAHYLNNLRARLPDSVSEPDRTWQALAAYNVGMGHLKDARKLAVELNKNPDLWQELVTILPLLSKHKYYTKLKHGYARGWEPVNYVKSIRDYQDVLEKVMDENSL
jgi:membrane-bound lytic murein transglycosylase F